MTQREMIELVQQHHPHLREKEVRKLLNRASDQFCQETEVYDTSLKDATIADQRFYMIGSTPIKIRRVDLDSKQIPRIIGQIEDTDIT